MKVAERWHMYLTIHQLKEKGFTVSQIARRMNISRNTVYKYLDLEPEEVEEMIVELKTRKKKLDDLQAVILAWLKQYPELSASQVLDWLEERYGKMKVCESTVRNYVRSLRMEYGIEKKVHKRQYEAVEDPPMGEQMQVDFGEIKVQMHTGESTKLYFITFVLSHSRYKYVEWLDRPFTTADVIRTHEAAFAYFEGMPSVLVYDQDHLILVSENHGDLIFTKDFTSYMKIREFKAHVCRRQDPESKGRVENAVGFVKKNFGRCRIFYNLDAWNEDCLKWLERTGNRRKHHTTKKIPAEVFSQEKHYLQPVNKITKIINNTHSITRAVRKDNTILYLSNRYSVPIGTYKGRETEVILRIEEPSLVILEKETAKEIARHQISQEKGKLIKNTNHARNRSEGIDTYIKTVSALFSSTNQATEFLTRLRKDKPRYIRDQLQLIHQHAKKVSLLIREQALQYCLKQQLYRATDFVDALTYFERTQGKKEKAKEEPTALTTLEPKNWHILKSKPEIRDLRAYKMILQGENPCPRPSQN